MDYSRDFPLQFKGEAIIWKGKEVIFTSKLSSKLPKIIQIDSRLLSI